MANDPRDEVMTFQTIGGSWVPLEDYAALREKLEAAEARQAEADSLIAELRQRYADGQIALTEARAGQAAAWEACHRDCKDIIAAGWTYPGIHINALTPPADLTAALAAHDQRVRDVEREAVAYYIGAVPSELPYRQEHMEAIRTGRYLNHVNMTDFRALKKGGET